MRAARFVVAGEKSYLSRAGAITLYRFFRPFPIIKKHKQPATGLADRISSIAVRGYGSAPLQSQHASHTFGCRGQIDRSEPLIKPDDRLRAQELVSVCLCVRTAYRDKQQVIPAPQPLSPTRQNRQEIVVGPVLSWASDTRTCLLLLRQLISPF